MNKWQPISSSPNRHVDPCDRWGDVAYWLVLTLACVAFFVMNVLTTLKEDDMAFALVEGVWTPVQSLMDVLRSHGAHYVNSNGRLADMVPELFSGVLGKWAFNVCNTLVFGVLLHVLGQIVTGRRSLLVVAMFLAVVGTCFPVPGETMLWMAGSANYMWAITLSLLLVRYLQRGHRSPLGWGRAIGLLLFAFVAGGFNEATSFGFFAGLCVYYLCNRDRFDRRAAVALAGYLLGIMLIVVSPGAWDRLATSGIVSDLGLGELLASRWFIFHEKVWRFLLPVAACLVGVAALLAWRARAVRRCVWAYVFIALSLVMLALGIIHERAYAPLVAVAFIIVALAVDDLVRNLRWACVSLVVAALGLAAFTFARGIGVLRDYKAFDDAVVTQVAAAPRQAVLPERQFDGYSRFVKPMNFISTNFFAHELIYRAYFGKDNVQFVSDSVYARYHQGRLLEGAVPFPVTTSRPDVITDVLSLPGQDYMVAVLKTDTLPATFQTARYYHTSPSRTLDAREQAMRSDYGITTDYSPRGFYPLAYQGRSLLILPPVESTTARIVIPLSLNPEDGEITLSPLYRTQQRPE